MTDFSLLSAAIVLHGLPWTSGVPAFIVGQDRPRPQSAAYNLHVTNQRYSVRVRPMAL